MIGILLELTSIGIYQEVPKLYVEPVKELHCINELYFIYQGDTICAKQDKYIIDDNKTYFIENTYRNMVKVHRSEYSSLRSKLFKCSEINVYK
jgi:hypothetical protein